MCGHGLDDLRPHTILFLQITHARIHSRFAAFFLEVIVLLALFAGAML